MNKGESIWTILGVHPVVQWDARFAEAAQTTAPINSSAYFTQRMEAAVILLATIHSELMNEVRRAYDNCTVPKELESSESLASIVLGPVLSRCIESIRSQLAEGHARGLLNFSMLEGFARDRIQSAQAIHTALAQRMAIEIEQRRQQLLVPTGADSARSLKHSVCLIHGIRTRAEWSERAASILEKSDSSIRAVPMRYGFFDVVRFLLPSTWTRNGPIDRITRLLRDEIARRPNNVSIIAHSFGTYILAKILQSTSDIRFHRVILCGSIIPDGFPWENFHHRLDADSKDEWHAVNDCGMRDIWPVFAASATWGYGSSGRFGFGHGRVKDRFFDVGHGGFFSEDHIAQYWLPYLSKGVVFDGVLLRATTPWWVSLLTVVKVRYLVVALASIAIISVLAPLVKDTSERERQYFERPGIHLGMSWGEFSEVVKNVEMSVSVVPGKTDATYTGVFWNLPAQIRHEFVDRHLVTSLISIKAEECDAIMYDASMNSIGTASQQCGVGPITIDADRACQMIGEKYNALVVATGGPIDELENREIARQWLGDEIIRQHSGNGWQARSTGELKDSARLERFKVAESTYVQFQMLEWNWDYWTIDPARQVDPNVQLEPPFPFPLSDHYKRFGCFLQYRVSAKDNFDWDFQERRYR